MSEELENVFDEDEVVNVEEEAVEEKDDNLSIYMLAFCGPKEFVENTKNWHKGKKLNILCFDSLQNVVLSIATIVFFVMLFKSIKNKLK